MPRQYDPNRPLSPKSYLKTISIVYLALLSGQVIFGIIPFSIEPQHGISYDTKDPFVFVAPLLAIAGVFAGIFIFKKQVAVAIGKTTLKEKLMAYQAALIQRFALTEGPYMFAIIAYLLSGNLLFIAIAGLLLLYFLSLRPTKDNLENDLELSYEDKVNFESEDTIL